MTSTALASTGKPTRMIGRQSPLLRVMGWELRRSCTSRLFWLQALGFFCLSSFVIWAQHIPLTLNHMQANVLFLGYVAGTSAWGLLMILPSGTLMLLGLLLPFVNADGVTRDRHRHTHELLMATALPTWAYVWGRYLAGLVMSLGLALLLLAAILGMGWFFHLTSADYPAPEIGVVLLLWVGIIVSATVLLSSLSFALGTLLPRLAMLVKVVILLAWFVGVEIISIELGDASHAANFSLPAWYINWDLTSNGISLGLFNKYMTDFSNLASKATSTAQTQHGILTVENTLIDLGSWFSPHLLLAGLSLVLVLVAALAFKRSRERLN
jgi:ABC-type transport system involved in multi-copper enzyme maturation permease subunit